MKTKVLLIFLISFSLLSCSQKKSEEKQIKLQTETEKKMEVSEKVLNSIDETILKKLKQKIKIEFKSFGTVHTMGNEYEGVMYLEYGDNSFSTIEECPVRFVADENTIMWVITIFDIKYTKFI